MQKKLRHSNQPDLEDGGDRPDKSWVETIPSPGDYEKKKRKRKKKKSKRGQPQEQEEEDSTREKPETRGTEPNIWFEGRSSRSYEGRAGRQLASSILWRARRSPKKKLR
jgi:hypothetical protein